MAKGSYRSSFERTIAGQLEASGVDYSYETKEIPYTIHHTYHPDFIVGSMVLEVKGFLRRQDIAKMRAVRQQYPDMDIRFVFMDANKLIPGTKTTHAKWADRHGFPWCDGRIPDEWLKPG